MRLHFSPFSSSNYILGSANFSVSVNGFVLLHNFSTRVTVLKEFILKIDDFVAELAFFPARNSDLAFVNAIEVFSAPGDLILDYGAKFVGPNGVGEYNNLSSQTLETIFRVNVGGWKLTPFNDTLWRNWVSDEGFLVLKSAAKSAVTTRVPNFQAGGASREIAPDGVYMTAQQMNRDNLTTNSIFNISWDFPVGSRGVQHLVRLHFCDIVSPSLNVLYFDVFINEYSAYKDLDLSTLTYNVLASPYYTDFVVNSSSSASFRISVGPSSLSTPLARNAILNGVEIMKMIDLVKISPVVAKKHNIWVVVILTVVGFAFIIATIVILLILRFRKKKPKRKPTAPMDSAVCTSLAAFGGSPCSRISEATAHPPPGSNLLLGLKIPFVDLELATMGFSKDLIIGSGGFGLVYKGVLRDNTKIAVKRGVPGSRQGLPEFQTEITILSKIRHHHLVSLVGYCEEQSEMILVYEYMEKGSLKKHLYGSEFEPLSWKQRLEICIGAARGIHYLHTGSAHGIIHRDIKSTNILLDANCVAKVADFGLSRTGPCLDQTHVSTGVKGSFGYLDPEYFRRQQLTDKSDVYSFGVVLLEVLCARPAVDPLLAREQVNLAEWAMEQQKKGQIEKIIDPLLAGQVKMSSLKKFSDIAEKCLADYAVDRPTMGDVLWNLEYALQLEENASPREVPQETDVNAAKQPETNGVVPGNETLDISTGKVFSQLMNREGR